tara:strand:- start:32 stop:205 length:174 start_codon:yes stop_codon:yes gene_type:complete
MNIKSAQYGVNLEGNNAEIKTTINDKTVFVPLDPNNRHYAEILKQVEEGTLTIKDAD